MGSTPSAGGFPPEGPADEEPDSVGGLNSTEEPEAMDTDFETSSVDEAEAMEIDEAPPSRDWRTQYLDWMI